MGSHPWIIARIKHWANSTYSQDALPLHLDPDGVAPHRPLIELVALVAIR